MLVNAKGILDKALEDKYAVGHFNINNLEWTKHILLASEKNRSAVILGVSEGAAKYMGGYNVVVGMVNGMLKDLDISIPVALHLDHGTYEGSLKAIDAGFSSVMFDGSKLPFKENIKKTRKIVKLAHGKGISVEAEVGAIGEEEGIGSEGEIADPKECKKIVDLGIDFLAAGIGNIHGVYPDDWKGLDFESLENIKNKIGNIPLVLHGGTGINEDMLKQAIKLGVSKINVNTEIQIAFNEEVKKYYEYNMDKNKKGFDPRKILAGGNQAIEDVVTTKMEFFGSINKY